MSEIIHFPMAVVNITTSVNELSHLGTNAIDMAGRDTGIENVFAPFTGVVKKIWPNGNTVWLESVEPVRFADGTVDFATANFTHDNNVSDLRVGQRIEQGQPFYQEGSAGLASGNHVHMSIAKGRFSGTGWYANSYGIWELNGSVHPTAAFVLRAGAEVVNSRGLSFNKEDTSMQEGIINDNDDIAELWRFGFFREPTAAELAGYQSLIGKYWSDAIKYLRQSDAGKEVRADYLSVPTLKARIAKLEAEPTSSEQYEQLTEPIFRLKK